MSNADRNATRWLGWALAAVFAGTTVAFVLFVGWMFGIF